MSVFFEELGKTSVHIGIGSDGKYIEVPMLTIGDYDSFKKMQRDLALLNQDKKTTDTERIDALLDARAKLAELAAKVMPVELHEHLKRMDYPTISALVMVLCTGKDDSAKDDPEKKTILPSQLPKTVIP